MPNVLRQGRTGSTNPTTPPPPRDASEGRGPERWPQRRLERLEEVTKAVGGGYCPLQMPLKPTLGVRETVAGHRLGALQGVGYLPLPMHPSPPPPHTPWSCSECDVLWQASPVSRPADLILWSDGLAPTSRILSRTVHHCPKCSSSLPCVPEELSKVDRLPHVLQRLQALSLNPSHLPVRAVPLFRVSPSPCVPLPPLPVVGLQFSVLCFVGGLWGF